ncbi:hypothetical protein GWK47_054208 [Chionoecetes opilio]|uniref:Uncharacterized protein n=1 Tax=Chionoecetes opilio TaxID=41210 RepID=A0A8J4XZ13_CHIOP|nr:hypothetical protein GWK47_054208 [Chionoecetes opilio]
MVPLTSALVTRRHFHNRSPLKGCELCEGGERKGGTGGNNQASRSLTRPPRRAIKHSLCRGGSLRSCGYGEGGITRAIVFWRGRARPSTCDGALFIAFKFSEARNVLHVSVPSGASEADWVGVPVVGGRCRVGSGGGGVLGWTGVVHLLQLRAAWTSGGLASPSISGYQGFVPRDPHPPSLFPLPG